MLGVSSAEVQADRFAAAERLVARTGAVVVLKGSRTIIASPSHPPCVCPTATDHEGAGEILKSCGRALIFGDKNTTAQYAQNPAIQVHGPGFSKILIGDDEIERWPEFIDLMVSSIADNGGRSCVNASAVVVPKYAAEIADALARKLGPIAPTAPDSEALAEISAHIQTTKTTK